jgi:hypothetical protein
MRSNLCLLLLCCGVVSVQPPARAQTLVYSFSYVDTASSRRAFFANVPPMPGARSDDQNIAMMRSTRKNEIYSISIADGKRSLLFSDDGTHLEISAGGTMSRGAKAYTVGVWRERRMTPSPGFYSDDGIYELSLDSSNHFRKIGTALSRAAPVLNPQATQAAVQSADAQSILIYSVLDWKVLSALNVAKLVQTHCPACVTTSFGWLADGRRLFVELVVTDEDDGGAANHPGAYIISADGVDQGAIPPGVGAFQYPGYVRAKFIDRHLLGQSPDGRYLFLDYGVKQGNSDAKTAPFLIIAGSDPKSVKQFPLRFPIGTIYLSPSGKYCAYLESRQTPDYRSEPHLWVRDLNSGDEKELFSVPPPNPPQSPTPNILLSILGWTD